jgi:hypothetical protein
MLGRRFRVGVAVTAMAIGAGLGTSAASASTGSATHANGKAHPAPGVVWSDTINFADVATPAAGGGYTLASNNCNLTSDGEHPVYPCMINLTLDPATMTGTGHAQSEDGVQSWAFGLVPTPVAGQFTVVNNCAANPAICYEIDSDGGPSIMYPIADVTGTVTIAPIAGTPNLNVNGTFMIWEDPTQP